jgi:predicted enzyme related to lactoylglutathione lyase
MSLFKDVQVISYHVTDWERAKKFYAEVLEWPVAYGSDEIGWFEYGVDGATHISISRWEGELPPREGAPIAVFTVADAHAATAALRAKGVRCDDPEEIPGVVTYGTFYDPDGNRLQFASS